MASSSRARKWLAAAASPLKAVGPRLSAAWAWARVHRQGLGRAAAHAAAVGSFLFLVLLVHRAVYSALKSSPRYRVPDALARASVAPTWADADAPESVVVLPAGRGSLLDDRLVPDIAEAFARNPWVRRVTSVERAFPDQVRVRFEMRHPRLAVRRPEGAVLVGEDGIRLPGAHPIVPAGAVEVFGTASVPPSPGRAWDSPEILAALEMAAVVDGEPLLRRLGVRALDVSNLNGRKNPREAELALRSSSGAWIAWGRLPSSGRYGEPSVPEKLDNLRLAAQNYPNLEGLAAVKVHQRGTPRCVLADPGVVRRPPPRR